MVGITAATNIGNTTAAIRKLGLDRELVATTVEVEIHLIGAKPMRRSKRSASV
jgi:hypothetical protein